MSMILFHFTYDLVYIQHIQLDWFTTSLIKIWVPSISYSFIFIAGCMCVFSKNSFKRAGLYALVALTIFVITTLAHIDTPINFGIFYCMAACTFVEAILSYASITPKDFISAILLLFIFILLIPLPYGYIGIDTLKISLPHILYESPYFAWIGFPSATFSSGDYYPLLPYVFLFLSGSAFNRKLKQIGFPVWFETCKIPIITQIGKQSLLIYLLHQPILLLISTLVAHYLVF